MSSLCSLCLSFLWVYWVFNIINSVKKLYNNSHIINSIHIVCSENGQWPAVITMINNGWYKGFPFALLHVNTKKIIIIYFLSLLNWVFWLPWLPGRQSIYLHSLKLAKQFKETSSLAPRGVEATLPRKACVIMENVLIIIE